MSIEFNTEKEFGRGIRSNPDGENSLPKTIINYPLDST